MKSLKRSKIFSIIFLFIIVISLYFLNYLMASEIANVKYVKVYDGSRIELDNLSSDISESFLGRNILKINETEIKSIIKERFSDYNYTGYKKSYPSSITVFVDKKNTEFFILAENGLFSVDNKGVVIKEQPEKSPGVYYIELNKNIEIGEMLPENLVGLGTFLKVQKNIVYDGNKAYLFLNNGLKIILPLPQNDAEAQIVLSRLQKVAQKYTIDNEGLEVVDLRFSKPVIK